MDDSQDAAAALDVEMSLRREDPRSRPDGLFAQREVRAKVVHTMRTRGARDPELLALLDAHEDGHHREGEVTERLDMTEATHHNLRRRFHTLRGHVPPELRADMLDMLTRDGGPPVATVARQRGRVVEIAADDTAVNDSDDRMSALDGSSDGDRSDDGSGDDFDRDAA